MIKFTVTGDKGRKLVAFALSAENIRRIQAKDPIFFPGEDLGFESIDFLIMAGDTEESIEADLRKSFNIRSNDAK